MIQSGIPPPTQFANKVNRSSAAKSPSSNGKRGRGTGGRREASSLNRRFNQLDQGTRMAINDSFVHNIKSGKASATTVQDALKEFYGKDTVAK